MNNPPYVTVNYAFKLWHFMKIPPFLFLFNCTVNKLHKHYENVRSSVPRGHSYAGCVNFFNHLDDNFFVKAPEIFFYVNKHILRYSSFNYTCIYICH